MASCTTFVAVDDLIFRDNVRSEGCTDIPGMVASYRRAGTFKVNHPLVCSQKDDGLLVLNGNRRGLGLVWLRDNDPSEFAGVCPKGKIPAVVHKGLTVEEEVDLRIDHSSDEDRVPLDDWSVYLAVKQLIGIGSDTQEEIARKLGIFNLKGKKKGEPNRNYIQPRANLARLPMFVQDEMEKRCFEPDSTHLRWATIPSLYKLHNKEYVEFPNADGPLFQAAWKKALTPPEDAGMANGDGSKELSPAAAKARSQSASSNGLKAALLAVTQQGDGNLVTIDAIILEGETAVILLGKIKGYLGEADYAILVSNATSDTVEPELNDYLTEEEIGELVETV